MRRWTIFVILTLLLALSACGGTATTGDGPEVATPEGVGEETPVVTEGGQTQDPAAMAAAALAYLSAQTGIPLTDMRVVSAEAQEWPNSALGCPSMDPATSYMAVITPGYLIVAEAGGESFNLHTNEDFSIVVLCEDGHPAGEGSEGGAADLLPTLGGEAAMVATAALNTLVQETGLSAEGLALTQMDEVVRPDSAIGCPKEGEMALQVLTNGFRLIFEASGERHFVHTNEDGSYVVVCGEEVPLPTDTTNPDS